MLPMILCGGNCLVCCSLVPMLRLNNSRVVQTLVCAHITPGQTGQRHPRKQLGVTGAIMRPAYHDSERYTTGNEAIAVVIRKERAFLDDTRFGARIALVLSVFAVVVAAQETTAGQAAPSMFQVISIRPVPSNAKPQCSGILHSHRPHQAANTFIHGRDCLK